MLPKVYLEKLFHPLVAVRKEEGGEEKRESSRVNREVRQKEAFKSPTWTRTMTQKAGVISVNIIRAKAYAFGKF